MKKKRQKTVLETKGISLEKIKKEKNESLPSTRTTAWIPCGLQVSELVGQSSTGIPGSANQLLVLREKEISISTQYVLD